MKKSRLLGILFSCFCLLSDATLAASVVDYVTRSVRIDAYLEDSSVYTDSITNASTGLWSAYLDFGDVGYDLNAGQNSYIDPQGSYFSVYADASSYHDTLGFYGDGIAETFFEVGFTIDIPYVYTLEGYSRDYGFSLHETISNTFIVSASNNDFISASDILGPGSYRLETGSFAPVMGDSFVTSDTQVFLTLTAIPIPAALWLFGSGFLGLIGIARRKS